MTIHHVLATKYNAPISYVASAEHRPGLDPEWLKHREHLFATWTAPSVAAQTVVPDRWVLLVDADTPREVISRILRIAGPRASAARVDGVLDDKTAADLILEQVPAKVDVLVTSRLDSDDLLSTTFCERVRRAAVSGVRGFVNPRHGLQLTPQGALRKADSSSPFLSLVEDVGSADLRTVFCVEHYRAADIETVTQLGRPFAWGQVIHAGNIVNQADGFPLLGAVSAASRELGRPVNRGPMTSREHSVAAYRQARRELLHGLRRARHLLTPR